MAGDWIQMRTNLGRDPRVKCIARALGINRAEAVGHLHAFWSWVDQHSTDGRMRGSTLDDVDEETIPGFGAALCQPEVGWLQEVVGGLLVVDFEVYNGTTAKTRAANARRQQRHRASGEKRDDSVTADRDSVFSSIPPPAVAGGEKPEPPKEPPAPRRAAKHALPPDFGLTAERLAYAIDKLGASCDVPAMFEQFRAHHLSKDSRFVDWGRVWQTWVLNGKNFGFPKLPPPIGSALSRAGERTAQAGQKFLAAAAPPLEQLTRVREPGEEG